MGDKSPGKNKCAECVCVCAGVCTPHTHMCQNTDADAKNGMWKLTGAVRPEAAFPASGQNVFFTLGLMAGTSLLKSSGR